MTSMSREVDFLLHQILDRLFEHYFQVEDAIDARIYETMKRLTTISAFLPPLVTTGYWGMNFQRMPELTLEGGPVLPIAMMVVAPGGRLLYFKRRGWI